MRRWGLAVVVLAALSGCVTRAPLSYALKQGRNLSETELKELQYFLSEEIVLRRVQEADVTKVTPKAALVLVDGSEEEVIRLPKGTPGVVVAAGPDWLLLRFEQNGGTLKFRATRAPVEKDPRKVQSTVVETEGDALVVESPGDAWEDRFKLAATGWSFSAEQGGFRGRVLYHGKEYESSDSSAHACLLIDQARFTRAAKSERTVSGLLVPVPKP